jgi:hypothetical protein
VRVFKKSPAGVATIKFRLPDAAAAAARRFASTVAVSGMFTPAALAADPALKRDVTDDLVLKCAQLGVQLAREADDTGAPRAPVAMLPASSAGRVLVACASVVDAVRCVAGVHGLGYAGVSLQAAQLTAVMWGAHLRHTRRSFAQPVCTFVQIVQARVC